MYRLRAKRTIGNNPPPDLLYGELAYSDANKRFYLGRADETQPPVVLQGDAPDYGPNIAALETDVNAAEATLVTHGNYIAALAAENSTQAAEINALEARPLTYGFTYDQQAEPIAPAVGQTWRERSAEGAIVGEWEWSGSVWLSLERFIVVVSQASPFIPFNRVNSYGMLVSSFSGSLYLGANFTVNTANGDTLATSFGFNSFNTLASYSWPDGIYSNAVMYPFSVNTNVLISNDAMNTVLNNYTTRQGPQTLSIRTQMPYGIEFRWVK